MTGREPPCVRWMSSADLVVRNDPWPYANNHHEAIAAHWNIAIAANPAFFNGTIHVITELQAGHDHVVARFMPTEFKNFLYWRDEGFPAEANVRDGFGSALIRSAEGHVVLGRQRPGHINEGLAYLPGGFIDPRDVDRDGRIDLYASVEREIAEETGLGPNVLQRQGGFFLVEADAHVAFAVSYASTLTSQELATRIAAHIAGETEPELAEAVVLRGPEDLRGLATAHYARVLLSSSLAWSRT